MATETFMNSLRYAFEELPDFWDDEFRSGAHNGCAEICYSESGEWTVRAITLDCHNGRCGDAAKGKTIPLSRAHQGALWEALCESLDAVSRPLSFNAYPEAKLASSKLPPPLFR